MDNTRCPFCGEAFEDSSKKACNIGTTGAKGINDVAEIRGHDHFKVVAGQLVHVRFRRMYVNLKLKDPFPNMTKTKVESVATNRELRSQDIFNQKVIAYFVKQNLKKIQSLKKLRDTKFQAWNSTHQLESLRFQGMTNNATALSCPCSNSSSIVRGAAAHFQRSLS